MQIRFKIKSSLLDDLILEKINFPHNATLESNKSIDTIIQCKCKNLLAIADEKLIFLFDHALHLVLFELTIWFIGGFSTNPIGFTTGRKHWPDANSVVQTHSHNFR